MRRAAERRLRLGPACLQNGCRDTASCLPSSPAVQVSTLLIGVSRRGTPVASGDWVPDQVRSSDKASVPWLADPPHARRPPA